MSTAEVGPPAYPHIVTARDDSPYHSAEAIWRRARLPPAALQRLAEADAFFGWGLIGAETVQIPGGDSLGAELVPG